MCAADFRTACKKAGLALIVIFAARCVADAVTALIGALMADCDAQITSSVQALANILILYVLAIAVTSKLLGYHFDGSLYKKPKRLGKAISWFVPMYGAGQAANIAVMAISFFIVQNRSAVEDTLTPIVSSGTGRGAWYLAFLFIQMAVLAPVFEEYWFRGVIQSSLAPYGNGFAILVSSLCFGMAHGNIHQFCYTVIVGICLGYVRYATGSLVPTMIMHAIFNSIAGIAIVAVSSETFISAFTHIQQGEELTGGEQAFMTTLMIYLAVILTTAVVGIAAAIGKLKNNRLYRPVNNYPALTKKQKFTAVAKEPLFIVGFILCTAYIIAMMII
jgi:membrane protease YdiL (CAAX protease family)